MVSARNAGWIDEAKKEGVGFADLLRFDGLAFRPGGAMVTHSIHIRQLLNESGVASYGNLAIYGRGSSETVKVLDAFAVGPEGAVTPIRREAIQVRAAESGSMFSDTKEIIIPFEGLEAGATVVLVTEKAQKPGFPLPPSWRRVTTRHNPVFETVVRFKSEDSRQLRFATNDPDMVCDPDGPTGYVCTRMSANTLREDKWVSWLDIAPQLAITQNGSWRDLVDKELSNLGHRGVDPAVAKVAAEIAGGLTDRSAQMSALQEFVAHKIRYVGMEHGEGSVVPRPAALTLSRRYGDCKDKTMLFVSMARALGLEAFPALVASNVSDPNSLLVTSWGYFDHMIAGVRLNNETRYVDLTARFQAGGTLPGSLYGRVVLPLVPGNVQPSVMAADAVSTDIDIFTKNEFRKRWVRR